MHWILQTDCFQEKGFRRLLETLERLTIPHSIHDIIPFTMDLHPELDPVPAGPIMVMGALKLARIAQERGWWPGSFLNDNFDYRVEMQHWPNRMLNADARFSTFADVPEPPKEWRGMFFIRPVHDNKAFNGRAMSWKQFQEWRHEVVDEGKRDGYILDGNTEVMTAQATNLYQEYRIWVVDGKVVTGSLYKLDRRPHFLAQVDEDVLRFAQETVDIWGPADCFVLDVARTSNGLSIIEAGNINSAGFYEANMGLLVDALERYVEKRTCEASSSTT